MLCFIYPYRDRKANRVKNSLDSLFRQSYREFKVIFVDYGSSPAYREKLKNLCGNYSFVEYKYCHTRYQPWNKSRALNSVIKNLSSDFCFVADVDMIFHPDFVKKADQLQRPDTTVYFQVGFLSPDERVEEKKYNEFTNYRKSTSDATGLSMFPVKVLQELRGFDEFYHFWGAEDTDMHIRLKNAGYPVEYYEKEILMLHQWHPSYRSKESKKLTENLQLKGIVQLNHQHLKFAIRNNVTKVNPFSWGNIHDENDLKDLEQFPVNLKLANEKREITDLLYGQLPVNQNKILKVQIRQDPFETSLKYRTKKILRKKVPKYYSLKEINDLILLHIISFHRHRPYIFKIGEDFHDITFAIKF